MPDGFFKEADLAVRRRLAIPLCGKCGLYRGCESPKMPVAGRGERGILIVGEAPGETEDRRGRPFVGKTGSVLRQTLANLGCDMDRDCWQTNSLICRPPDNDKPTQKQIEYCRPNLLNAIEELKPSTIILVGEPAVDSLIGWLWKENPGAVTQWVGWRIPHQTLNSYICPTYHPSYIVREDSPALNLIWKRHLKAALECEGRPWAEVPDWRKQVRIEDDADKGVGIVDALVNSGRPVAFDYENDRLKPDHPNARIVCCAVSNGRETVAYPWHGGFIDVTRKFLVSDVPKIAHNLKHEARWSRKLLGVWPKNWLQDSMIASHVLDHRGGITSLKFQSFVRFGMPPYNDRIKPFFEGEGGNGRNRIHEVPITRLLEYCGLDALLEWKLARVQHKELGR